MLCRKFAGALAAVLIATAGHAEEAKKPLRIGVLTDMSGILSSALGPGSVDGARMAVEDFGGTMFGQPIELLTGDHQNKPDIGSGLVRRWFDETGVDVVADVGNSAVALAVRELVQSKNRIALYAGASSADLTGKACSPNTAQWSHDTYLFANALPAELMRQGKKTWFLIVQDWAFGHALERDISKVVTEGGGKVIGSIKHPPGTLDFASMLLQAQTSGAEIVAFLSAGQDLSTMIKQADEFGLKMKQQLVAPAFLLSDAHGLGPKQAQGIMFATVWYWNLNPEARAWSERFFKRNKFMPAEAHAGTYSAVSHYLKAVKATGTTEPLKVMAKMREMPVNDFYSQDVKLREDGRLMRKAYIGQMKTPEQSREPWDYYNIVSEIPPERAFRPASERACALLP
jgi:branched-chain amino acid transport system substrate-binding protein